MKRRFTVLKEIRRHVYSCFTVLDIKSLQLGFKLLLPYILEFMAEMQEQFF